MLALKKRNKLVQKSVLQKKYSLLQNIVQLFLKKNNRKNVKTEYIKILVSWLNQWKSQIKKAFVILRSKRFFFTFYKNGYIILQSSSRLNYLIVYKLNVPHLNKLLQIQIVSYRSSYLGKNKRESGKKRFLWNLYFLYKIRWFRLDNLALGKYNETTKGWGFDVLVSQDWGLELFGFYHHLIHKLLYEKKRITGYKVHHDWLALRPYAWVPLHVNLSTLWIKPQQFTRYEFYKYWTLDRRNHQLQYRILTSLPTTGELFQKHYSRFTIRWLKTFLLRIWKHPTLYDYTYLRVIRTLIRYGYNKKIPLKLFSKKDFIWQADPVGLRIKQVLDAFVAIKVESRSFFTEKLIEKHWIDSLTSQEKVGKMIRADWIYRPSINMLGVLNKRWKQRR